MVKSQEEVKAAADAIMKAPMSVDPYSPEGRAILSERSERYRQMWTAWCKERDDELAAERRAERAAEAKAQREAEKEERKAAAAEGRTVRTVKGEYRKPKGEQAPAAVKTVTVAPKATVKAQRACKACSKPIPPSGKRGRPAAYHDACRP